MRRLARFLVVMVCIGVTTALVAPPAGAKLLPYQLRLDSPRVVQLGEPVAAVAAVMQLDPQNVFPETIEFEIHWVKLRKHQPAVKGARRGPGNLIVMHQIGPKEYRGTFTPPAKGRYAVYGRTALGGLRRGYPFPRVVHVIG
jgi:hypothetical protein